MSHAASSGRSRDVGPCVTKARKTDGAVTVPCSEASVDRGAASEHAGQARPGPGLSALVPPQELEREKHAHSLLRFQLAEATAALKQREEMLEVGGAPRGPSALASGLPLVPHKRLRLSGESRAPADSPSDSPRLGDGVSSSHWSRGSFSGGFVCVRGCGGQNRVHVLSLKMLLYPAEGTL